MTAHAATSRYQKVQATTCSPVKLVSMLFDGAVRFANEAADAIEKKDRARAGERIGRCHAVIEQLAASLDPNAAPDLCDDLMGIYAFCMRRLLEANIRQDRAALAEVVQVLTPLQEAWANLSTRP